MPGYDRTVPPGPGAKEGKEFSQGLTSPIVLVLVVVLVLDFDRYWLGEPKAT